MPSQVCESDWSSQIIVTVAPKPKINDAAQLDRSTLMFNKSGIKGAFDD